MGKQIVFKKIIKIKKKVLDSSLMQCYNMSCAKFGMPMWLNWQSS